MTVSIVGSRTFDNKDMMFDVMNKIITSYGFEITKVISGGAIGADKLAEAWCRETGTPIEIIKPDWAKYGKSAGFIRNKDIIKSSETCIALWDMQSKGTKDDIRLCARNEIPVVIVNTNDMTYTYVSDPDDMMSAIA